MIIIHLFLKNGIIIYLIHFFLNSLFEMNVFVIQYLYKRNLFGNRSRKIQIYQNDAPVKYILVRDSNC